MMEERLPPVHPGEVLLEDFMKPLGLTQYRVAQDIGVSPMRIRLFTISSSARMARALASS